jgi:Protein of unknown function (DUF2393)
MGGLIEPSPLSAPQRESSWIPIGLGVVFVVITVGIIAWFARSQPKPPVPPPPYAANLKLTDLKMSAAQNFVGATVTYLDGTITNAGNQTVTQVMIHVVFQDAMGQVAQLEDVPLHVLQTGGPYPDAVDLRVSPLAPGQSKTFRLTFEHVSTEWNQAYPQLQISDVAAK